MAASLYFSFSCSSAVLGHPTQRIPRNRSARRASLARAAVDPCGRQSGFAIVPLKTDHTDDAISSAQGWMHKNFAKTFPLEDPARRVGMSVRNFVRRFKQATGDSPFSYLQKLRFAAAKRNVGEQSAAHSTKRKPTKALAAPAPQLVQAIFS